MWISFILAFSFSVAVADGLWQKIPRELTVLGLFAGLGYHIYFGGFLSSILTAALAFTAGLGLYSLRAIGGGDVKLITAMAAILGFHSWLVAILVAVLATGILAIAGVIYHHLFWQTLTNVARLLKHFFQNGLRPHPEIQVNNQSLVRVPFGVAAALGIICTVMLP